MIETEARFAPLLGRRGIGLAVSGGGDSLALMLLVADWAARADAPPVYVYSVDHGLRPEAADEVSFVCAAAQTFGLLARPLRWAGDKPATGVSAAARAARYRLMADAMAADGADLLLTAHHMEDQAETVLMRLAHGSGVEGLRGMAARSVVEGCDIYRPLLDVPRAALRDLVVAAGLVPVEDPSNDDRDYERVRWRQMLPMLAGMGMDAARLSTFARRMGELDAMVEAEAEAAHRRLVRQASERRAELDHAQFAALARPVAVRLLGRLLASIGDGRKAHALAPIEALTERLRGGIALKRTSLHGCLILSDGVTVFIETEPGRAVLRNGTSTTAPA